jgi:hypothetical protein
MHRRIDRVTDDATRARRHKFMAGVQAGINSPLSPSESTPSRKENPRAGKTRWKEHYANFATVSPKTCSAKMEYAILQNNMPCGVGAFLHMEACGAAKTVLESQEGQLFADLHTGTPDSRRRQGTLVVRVLWRSLTVRPAGR